MARHTRSDVRYDLGKQMSISLVGPDKPAQKLYSYHHTKLDGASPVITLTNAGGGSSPLTARGDAKAYYYDINVLVIRPTPEEIAAGYNEQDVEDVIDELWTAIDSWIENNRRGPTWQFLEIDGRSVIVPVVDDGGRGYFMETVPIKATVY